MKIFNYHETTGEFTGWSEDATPCPIENPEGKPDGVWHYPAHSTTIKPPKLIKGNVVVFREGKWGYVYPDVPDMVLSDKPLKAKPEPPPRDPNAPPEGWVEPEDWWPPFDWVGTPGWKPKPEWLKAKAEFEEWQRKVKAEAEAKAAETADDAKT
jgi:hypothetical protein